MSAFEDQSNQFQIPASDTVDVPMADNPHWTAADEVILSQNLTGSNILDADPHDQNRWHEALTYNERLGLDQAAADVERRQREVDFNENQTETNGVYQEIIAEIDISQNIVLDLRARFCNDDGKVNGVNAVNLKEAV